MKSRYGSVDFAYAGVNAKPTIKQKKFFAFLCIKCRENGLSEKTGFILSTAEDYSKAITILRQRLKNAGAEGFKEEKR